MPPSLGERTNDARSSSQVIFPYRSQWPQQMVGGVHHIALCALLDEELAGDQQCSGEDERKHRGRELTAIPHRTSFSVFGSHEERRPTVVCSCKLQINCSFFPAPRTPTASIIDLHPQAARVGLLSAEPLRAVACRDGAGTGVDEIVTANAGAVSLSQPFRQTRDAALLQECDALLAALCRGLLCEPGPPSQIPKNQFRMRFADGRLPLRRHDLVDVPDLVPDVPELRRHAPALALALPVVPVSCSHIGKSPEVTARAEKHGGTDPLACAQIA